MPKGNFASSREVIRIVDGIFGIYKVLDIKNLFRIDKTNDFSGPERTELWRKIGEMGLFGLTIPVEYGGLGLTYLEQVSLIGNL